MPKYSVSVIFDACKCVEVEAGSPKQAADMAYDEAGYVGLCHQCSGEVEMGDAIRAIVYDEVGEEVADDGYQAMEIAKITQQRDDLLAALELAEGAYRLNLVSEGEPSSILDAMQKAIAKANGV